MSTTHRTDIIQQELEFYRNQCKSSKSLALNKDFEKKLTFSVYRRDVIQHEIDFNRGKSKSPKSIKSSPTSPLSESINNTIERKKALLTPILKSPSRDSSSIVTTLREERSLSPSINTRSSKSSKTKRSSFSPDVLDSVESFARATNGMEKDIERFKANDYSPIHLPEWNDRFMNGNSLDRDPFSH